MGLWKLRFTMWGTLALLISISTLVFAAALTLIGSLSLYTMLIFVIFWNLIQWLIAPYMIGAIYHAKPADESQYGDLNRMIDDLSLKSEIRRPKLMIADIPLPNAFAYGSPVSGPRVAVTTGLLKELETEEVEAVVGHELGHLKHRDVQIMMFASVIPAVFYMLGYSLMWSGMLGGGRRNNAGIAVLVGVALMGVYWLLTLLVLGLSRLREYYADRHSASIVYDGPRKLSEGLAKIVRVSGKLRSKRQNTAAFNSFKSLFIADPDRAARDEVAIYRGTSYSSDQMLVRDVISQRITGTDRLVEVFSTHPNIVKRLKALQELESSG